MLAQNGDYYHTGVLFRVFSNGEVIALFTESYRDGSCNHGMCMSYLHTGQHSEADPTIIYHTRPATPEEYSELKKELESIGYRFTKIYKRFPYRSLLA